MHKFQIEIENTVNLLGHLYKAYKLCILNVKVEIL